MFRQLQVRFATRLTRLAINYLPSVDKATQILLSLKYRELWEKGGPLPRFEDIEFRVFSQNGEDGILLYIFSLIGTTNQKCVEICAGTGVECNTANLIINHGWQALLVDGDKANVDIGRNFYAKCRDTFYLPPTFVHAWVTRENINTLLEENDFRGEIDLLSLDIDGVDYWIWEEIKSINPRVVVLEYNEAFGFEHVSVPYDPRFNRFRKDPRYWGASLPAYCALAMRKGYRLVGCNRQRLNAFFIRNDVGAEIFPAVSLNSCMSRKPEEYSLLKELSERFSFTYL